MWRVGKGDQNKVLFTSWCGPGGGLVSGGVKHIKFWELKGKSLRAKKGTCVCVCVRVRDW